MKKMNLNEFVNIMESIAPVELALEFDNIGLLIGRENTEIKKVLVALDCTLPVAKEAVALGVDLVLTHHPLLFHGVKRILPEHPDTAAAYVLLRNDIAMYAAHTNLDAAMGGVNDVLACMFGIADAKPVPPENIGRIGKLKEPVTLLDLCEQANSLLKTKVRCAAANFAQDFKSVSVQKIAFLGGSGGGDIEYMKAAGADAFVTGEIKHSQAIAAACMGISVLQAGHYETERIILAPLIKSLQNFNFDVQYTLALNEFASLRVVE